MGVWEGVGLRLEVLDEEAVRVGVHVETGLALTVDEAVVVPEGARGSFRLGTLGAGERLPPLEIPSPLAAGRKCLALAGPHQKNQKASGELPEQTNAQSVKAVGGKGGEGRGTAYQGQR